MTQTTPCVRGARLLHLGFFTGPATQIISRSRRTDECQLIVVTGGVFIATVDTPRGRQHIRAQAGDVVFWPTHSEDTEESEQGKPLRCISIFLRWPHPPPDLPFRVRDAEHLLDRLAHRLLAITHDPAGKSILADAANAYLAALLAEFVRLAQAVADPLLARVAEFTEQNIHRPIRLEELARLVELEKNHFGRKYKALTGRTPIEDVQRRKAIYAKHMLLETPSRTLANLAKYVGIRDAATLSRLLTRYTGTTARDIKRAARAKPAKRK
jgi:AraC-like DNA-binding protein